MDYTYCYPGTSVLKNRLNIHDKYRELMRAGCAGSFFHIQKSTGASGQKSI